MHPYLSTRGLSRREPPDRDSAPIADLHLQFVSFQQSHPDQGLGVGLVHKDLAYLSVPQDLRLVDMENAQAAVAQLEPLDGLPAEAQRLDQGRRQRQRLRV